MKKRKRRNDNDKVHSPGNSAKKPRQSKRTGKKLEHEYQQLFAPHPLPFQDLYTDEASLEQPSALKYVPTMTTPGFEA